MKEMRTGLAEVARGIINTARSAEMKQDLTDLKNHLYVMSRWVLAGVLHPRATFEAVMLIGSEERINRNVEHALTLPLGRHRLQP